MKPSPRLLKFLRRALLALAVTATLLAAFVVVENWRGDRAWAAEERALRARGEPLDLAAFATPPIPDERNFFKAPGIADLLITDLGDLSHRAIRADAFTPLKENLGAASYIGTVVATSTNYEADGRLRRGIKPESIVVTPGDPMGDWHLAQTRLLREKRITGPLSAEPAENILAAMKPVQAVLDAVRLAARERPEAWLPMQFSTDQPSLNVEFMLTLGKALDGRAKAELALGRTDDAFADVVGILGLARSTRAGVPTLLSTLVGEALRGITAAALKGGCRQHQWNEAQLATLQNLLIDPTAFGRFKRTLQMERIEMIGYLSSPSVSPPPKSGLLEVLFQAHGSVWAHLRREAIRLAPIWMPHGWFQQEKVAVSRIVAQMTSALDDATDQKFPSRLQEVKNLADALGKSHSPYHGQASLTADYLSKSLVRFSEQGNAFDEAVAACALERHRLARGSYPATIAELVPTFIAAVPADVFSGQPLGYTRTPDGGFKLTSLAADGKSEGKVWVQPGGP